MLIVTRGTDGNNTLAISCRFSSHILLCYYACKIAMPPWRRWRVVPIPRPVRTPLLGPFTSSRPCCRQNRSALEPGSSPSQIPTPHFHTAKPRSRRRRCPCHCLRVHDSRTRAFHVTIILHIGDDFLFHDILVILLWSNPEILLAASGEIIILYNILNPSIRLVATTATPDRRDRFGNARRAALSRTHG